MIDDSEVRRLTADLSEAPRRVQAGAYPVVKRAAVNVKNDWSHRWEGMTGLQHISGAISFDMHLTGLTSVEAEVGVDLDRRQGELGGIVEFGSSEHPPIRPVGKSVLETEAPGLASALGQLGDPL